MNWKHFFAVLVGVPALIISTHLVTSLVSTWWNICFRRLYNQPSVIHTLVYLFPFILILAVMVGLSWR